MWSAGTTLVFEGAVIAPVEFHETHTAQVLVGEGLAFKKRRPVDLFEGLINYATLQERWLGAQNEVAIGRRVCPGIYYGVFALGADGVLRPEERRDEEPIVVMKRLRGDRRADRVFEAGGNRSAAFVIAEECALFHDRCEREGAVREQMSRTVEAWTSNFDRLPDGHPLLPLSHSERVELIDTTLSWFERRGRAVLHKRILAGKVVEGHGDLHLKHVYFTDDARPGSRWAVIDPLEFSRDLRVLDVAAEVGFLAMDLDAIGRRDMSRLLVRAYAGETGDDTLEEVMPFFCRYRAVVRGLVAWATAVTFAADAAACRAHENDARRYFSLALSYRMP